MEKDIWNLIVSSYSQNPRDVITTPVGNRHGKWFHVRVEAKRVFISEAKEHSYSSKFTTRRELNPSEAEKVYELYLKRQKGVSNNQEVQETTMNSSYWFGIFSDLDL